MINSPTLLIEFLVGFVVVVVYFRTLLKRVEKLREKPWGMGKVLAAKV